MPSSPSVPSAESIAQFCASVTLRAMRPFVNLVLQLGILWVLLSNLILHPARPLLKETQEFYGLDTIHSFYGPGNWAAWMLTVLSCCLERSFVRERPMFEKPSHLLGLDLNVATAFGYPIVAACDLLSQWKNFYGDEVDSKNLGRLASSYVVLSSGANFGGFIQLLSMYSWFRSKTNLRTLVFTTACSVFLFIVLGIVDSLLFRYDTRYRWCMFVLVPFLDCDDPRRFPSRVFMAYWRSPLSLAGAATMPSDIDIISKISTYCILAMLITGFAWIATNYWNSGWQQWALPALYLIVVFGTFVWWGFQLFYYTWNTVVNLVFFPWSLQPITMSALTELDQLAAFVLGGVLVVLGSVVSVAKDNWENLRSAWDFSRDMWASISSAVEESLQILLKVCRLDGLLYKLGRVRHRGNLSQNF